jgi:hypothetical protein
MIESKFSPVKHWSMFPSTLTIIIAGLTLFLIHTCSDCPSSSSLQDHDLGRALALACKQHCKGKNLGRRWHDGLGMVKVQLETCIAKKKNCSCFSYRFPCVFQFIFSDLMMFHVFARRMIHPPGSIVAAFGRLRSEVCPIPSIPALGQKIERVDKTRWSAISSFQHYSRRVRKENTESIYSML